MRLLSKRDILRKISEQQEPVSLCTLLSLLSLSGDEKEFLQGLLDDMHAEGFVQKQDGADGPVFTATPDGIEFVDGKRAARTAAPDARYWITTIIAIAALLVAIFKP